MSASASTWPQPDFGTVDLAAWREVMETMKKGDFDSATLYFDRARTTFVVVRREDLPAIEYFLDHPETHLGLTVFVRGGGVA